MRRPRYLVIGNVVVGLALAACASPAGSEPGASSGSEPSAAAEASQAGGGGGGAGGIGITLSDGNWSSGDLHVTVSGDASGTYDAALVPGPASYTTAGESILSYVDADSQVSVGVAIYTDSFAISVTTAEVVAGGGTTMNCTVDYRTADDNNIEADFSCPNSPAFTATGTSGGTVNIEGSLTAHR